MGKMIMLFICWLTLQHAGAQFQDEADSKSITSSEKTELIPSKAMELKDVARVAAVTDSVSTYMAINLVNATEQNALVGASPTGLLTLLGVKLLLVECADTLDEPFKKPVMRGIGSFWSGISASNIAIAVGATNPIGVAMGLIVGAYMWNK
jgi:hypothetical protein